MREAPELRIARLRRAISEAIVALADHADLEPVAARLRDTLDHDERQVDR